VNERINEYSVRGWMRVYVDGWMDGDASDNANADGDAEDSKCRLVKK